MANYQTLTPKVYRGRGHAARAVGVPYDIYRIGATSSGNVLATPNKIASSYYALRRIIKGGASMETTTEFKTMFFEVVADTTNYEVGDIWVQNDPVYGIGYTEVEFIQEQFNAFCLAYNPPIAKKALGARLDRQCYIYRPNQAPDTNGYWDTTNNNSLPLILTNGIFAFGTHGQTPSYIPIGIMPFPRPSGGDQFKPGVDGMTEFPTMFIYVPPLDGIVLKEGDRIVTEEGDRFVIMVPWIQLAGVSGFQLGCKREIAGDGA